jgi:hypothetical protein
MVDLIERLNLILERRSDIDGLDFRNGDLWFSASMYVAEAATELTSLRTALATERERAEKAEKENVRLIEDRARFPDRPDDIGRMIGCHFGNLKAGKDAADKHASNAFDRALRAESSLAEAKRLLKVFADMGGEMFSRGWDASNVAIALDNPDDPHRVTADDFFATRRFLAHEEARPSTPKGGPDHG